MKTKEMKPCIICKAKTDNAIYIKRKDKIINVCLKCEYEVPERVRDLG